MKSLERKYKTGMLKKQKRELNKKLLEWSREI